MELLAPHAETGSGLLPDVERPPQNGWRLWQLVRMATGKVI